MPPGAHRRLIHHALPLSIHWGVVVLTANSFGGTAWSPLLSPHHRRSYRIFHRADTDASSVSSSSLRYGLYEVQEEMLVKRGQIEEELMAGNGRVLEASEPPRGVGAVGGGFGGGGKNSKKKQSKSLALEGKAHAAVLQREGVVRIDGVLSAKMAAELREFLFDLRERSTSDVASGAVDQIDRFADVLLRSNRCDLKVPLGPAPVTAALQGLLLRSPVGSTIRTLLSDDAVLYELSSLISDPGSQRQVVHPDNPFREATASRPTLLTCFVALQDITEDMGPTVWLPRTHNDGNVHERFQDETVGGISTTSGEEATGDTDDGGGGGGGGLVSPKDELLRSTQHVVGVLPAGSCAIYDSRLLHCGTANRHDEKSRALFYFSFRNPDVSFPGNPASIRRRIGEAELTLGQLSAELERCTKKKGSDVLRALAD